MVGQKQQQMGVTASFYDWARTKGQFNSTDERERERERKKDSIGEQQTRGGKCEQQRAKSSLSFSLSISSRL